MNLAGSLIKHIVLAILMFCCTMRTIILVTRSLGTVVTSAFKVVHATFTQVWVLSTVRSLVAFWEITQRTCKKELHSKIQKNILYRFLNKVNYTTDISSVSVTLCKNMIQFFRFCRSVCVEMHGLNIKHEVDVKNKISLIFSVMLALLLVSAQPWSNGWQ